MSQPARSGGMALGAAHFADPQQRAALFEGFLRDLASLDGAARHRALTQAMESAFMAGATLVRSDPGFDPFGQGQRKEPDMLRLDDLPHDAQDALIEMSRIVGLGNPGSHPGKEPEPLVLRPFYTSDGKRSWWAELPKDSTESRWSAWVVLTLERFGLITGFPGETGRSTLTHRAIALMQKGKASLDAPTTPAWERNAKARDLAVKGVRQPALY